MSYLIRDSKDRFSPVMAHNDHMISALVLPLKRLVRRGENLKTASGTTEDRLLHQ